MPESNKAMVCRWMEECFRQRNTTITDELFAEDHVVHESSVGTLTGLGALKQLFLADWFAAFADLNFRIDAQMAEGDRVMTYWRWSGTQTGEFLGVPATGRKVEVESVLVSRFLNGRIVETWELWDAFGCYRRLGVVSGEAEAQKKLIREHMEVIWNRGEVERVGEFFTEDCHFLALHSGEFTGLEARKQFVLGLRGAMPDMRFTVEEVISDGTTAVQRWRCTGTHLGEIFGMAPTGNVVPGSGTSTYRFRDGKIREELIQWDALGFMQALGAIPGHAQDAAFAR